MILQLCKSHSLPTQGAQQRRQKVRCLIPTILVPHQGQVICDIERTIFIKYSQFTAAPWASNQPYNNRVLIVCARLEEKGRISLRHENVRS
ncbi:hypothetical protein PRUPE_6G189300 [Prunus persica]|uniref:Uncharacterized protein n=1 Tax=Prunus persica TaxID=3760 RepID=A0A251NSK3_PRUPE|nr:hypothetical protein PRUPE_6G189300 [Prunus persica]